MAAIDLKEALSIIKCGDWIKSLKCLTANLTTGKAGKIIEYKNCRIARRQPMEEHGSPTTGTTGRTKQADHNFHFTINLELKNTQIRKVHPILIFEINKQPVI